jgi:hypothetical protein
VRRPDLIEKVVVQDLHTRFGAQPRDDDQRIIDRAGQPSGWLEVCRTV